MLYVLLIVSNVCFLSLGYYFGRCTVEVDESNEWKKGIIKLKKEEETEAFIAEE